MPIVIHNKCCDALKIGHDQPKHLESILRYSDSQQVSCRISNTTHTPARANQRRRTSSTAKQCASVIASSVPVKVAHITMLQNLWVLIIALSGGWDPQTGVIPEDINAQIDQAFENVGLALKLSLIHI